MVRWCIRLTRFTLCCEVIRYLLVQVRQNLKKKKTLQFGGLQSPFSISSSFILFFVLRPFFLKTKNQFAETCLLPVSFLGFPLDFFMFLLPLVVVVVMFFFFFCSPVCVCVCDEDSTSMFRNKNKYSETRLLRTLKGNEKRYVVTKVRYIQNAILLAGMTGSTVHANDLPRKMLLRSECRSLLAFRAVKSPFGASWTWKRAGKLKSKLKRSGRHARDQKKEPKKGQKSAPGGKIGT